MLTSITKLMEPGPFDLMKERRRGMGGWLLIARNNAYRFHFDRNKDPNIITGGQAVIITIGLE